MNGIEDPMDRIRNRKKILDIIPSFAEQNDRIFSLYEGEIYMIYGSPKSGKTSVLLWLLDHAVKKGIPTLLLDSENKITSLRNSILVKRLNANGELYDKYFTIRTVNDANAMLGDEVKDLVKKNRLILIDSITGLNTNVKGVRDILNRMTNLVKRENEQKTMLFTYQAYEYWDAVGGKETRARWGKVAEYFCDEIIRVTKARRSGLAKNGKAYKSRVLRLERQEIEIQLGISDGFILNQDGGLE